jgi:cysteine desulfurase
MPEERIYLDNAATTRLDDRVWEEMRPYYLEAYAVATSEFAYSPGIEAKETLEAARSTLAGIIGGSGEELILTSGSTEASNLALKGVAEAKREQGNHIIVSSMEDFPVLNSARALEATGCRVSYLPVDSEGRVDPDELRREIAKDTILVSIQHANQEIGTLQDIAALAAICREKEVLFHADATHSFARIPIDVRKIPVDLLTISAHTIHGPRGIGALYQRSGVPLAKQMHGGYQEAERRAGVENIPGAVGFAKAAQLITAEEVKAQQKLRDRIIDKLSSEIPDVTLNGPRLERIPTNANLTFHYVEGESLTLHLDMRGIAVSTGSACFSKSLEASHVIMAIGGDHERAHGSLRFTFGRFNRESEVDAVVEALKQVVPELRRISPLKTKDDGLTAAGKEASQ